MSSEPNRKPCDPCADRNIPNVQFVEFVPPPDLRCKPLGTKPKIIKPVKEPSSEEDVEIPIENVTVKFHINGINVIAQVYSNHQAIKDIKKDIAKKLEVNANYVLLKQDGREIKNDCLLLHACRNEYGIFEFELTLKEIPQSELKNKDGKQPVLDLDVYYNKYRLPDFITVNIPAEDTEDGQPKNIVVEIQNRAIIKPFLCGYRDKATGMEYLDAFTQTGPYLDKLKFRRYFSRDTQTYEWKEKILNTAHDQITQCFLDGKNVLYVSEASDFFITPGKYQTYAQKMRLENKLAKIILIQRNWRRYLLARLIKNSAREYRRLVANREAEERRCAEQENQPITIEERTKQFPLAKKDFELLYSELDKWKNAEMKRIAMHYEGTSRLVEVNLLLDKEIEMRKNIERQRNLVHESLKEFRIEKMLTKLGEPIQWVGYKDTKIHMDLLRTQRARFLTEVYKDLTAPRPRAERVELLTKVKAIVLNEYTFPDFEELMDLIQREINLLLYTKHCDVEILRKRINYLFKHLVKYTKDKAPTDDLQRMCEICKKVQPYSKFAVRTRQKNTATCSDCYALRAPSVDNRAYAALLRSIQREERRRRSATSFVFVLQVEDMRYLLDHIWHGHSVLSKDTNLHRLRLPRWRQNEEWTPWNCICLTACEAHAHSLIENPLEVYDPKLIRDVETRHHLARCTFETVRKVGVELVETGDWYRVALNRQRKVDLPNSYPRSAFPKKPPEEICE